MPPPSAPRPLYTHRGEKGTRAEGRSEAGAERRNCPQALLRRAAPVRPPPATDGHHHRTGYPSCHEPTNPTPSSSGVSRRLHASGAILYPRQHSHDHNVRRPASPAQWGLPTKSLGWGLATGANTAHRAKRGLTPRTKPAPHKPINDLCPRTWRRTRVLAVAPGTAAATNRPFPAATAVGSWHQRKQKSRARPSHRFVSAAGGDCGEWARGSGFATEDRAASLST